MNARASKHVCVAAAVLLFAAMGSAAWAHGGGHGGGHAGGRAGVHGGGHIGAPHGAGPAARVVAPGARFHPGGFHGRGAPAFHHGHWVHGLRGGTPGWWWVGAAAVPLYVQPSAPAVLVQPQALYYCNALQAYYPETLTCPEPWLLVAPDPGSIPE